MLRIVTLDIATRTGWASGPSCAAVPKYGIHQLPKTGDDLGWFLDAFDVWLHEVLPAWRPDLVAFECPVMPAQSQIMTLRKLYSLASHVELVCRRFGVECVEEHLQAIKKFITGAGNAKKFEVVRGVNRMFGLNLDEGRQDNEGDALGLWALTVHKRDKENAHRFMLGALAGGT